MALQNHQERNAQREREGISALFRRALLPHTVDLLVHGGFTVSVFERLKTYELPTLHRVLDQLHIKLSDQEREAVEECAERNSRKRGAALRRRGAMLDLTRRDEQEMLSYRQRESRQEVDQEQCLFEFSTSENQESLGEDSWDIEAGLPTPSREPDRFDDKTGCFSPLFVTAEDGQSRFAKLGVSVDADLEAELCDRLNLNAALASKELELIMKAGGYERPRRPKAYECSVVCL